jgi:hypothetical protein
VDWSRRLRTDGTNGVGGPEVEDEEEMDTASSGFSKDRKWATGIGGIEWKARTDLSRAEGKRRQRAGGWARRGVTVSSNLALSVGYQEFNTGKALHLMDLVFADHSVNCVANS